MKYKWNIATTPNAKEAQERLGDSVFPGVAGGDV